MYEVLDLPLCICIFMMMFYLLLIISLVLLAFVGGGVGGGRECCPSNARFPQLFIYIHYLQHGQLNKQLFATLHAWSWKRSGYLIDTLYFLQPGADAISTLLFVGYRVSTLVAPFFSIDLQPWAVGTGKIWGHCERGGVMCDTLLVGVGGWYWTPMDTDMHLLTYLLTSGWSNAPGWPGHLTDILIYNSVGFSWNVWNKHVWCIQKKEINTPNTTLSLASAQTHTLEKNIAVLL